MYLVTVLLQMILVIKLIQIFVYKKLYLRSNYIENNNEDIEEDIDLKNQYRIKNLPDPISIREAAS